MRTSGPRPQGSISFSADGAGLTEKSSPTQAPTPTTAPAANPQALGAGQRPRTSAIMASAALATTKGALKLNFRAQPDLLDLVEKYDSPQGRQALQKAGNRAISGMSRLLVESRAPEDLQSG